MFYIFNVGQFITKNAKYIIKLNAIENGLKISYFFFIYLFALLGLYFQTLNNLVLESTLFVDNEIGKVFFY